MTRTLALGAVLLLAACDDTVFGTPHNATTDSGTGTCDAPPATWEGVVALYDDHCASCHANGVQPEFTTSDWEDDLASGDGTWFSAGDAEDSLVYQRLIGVPSAMPPGAPLEDCVTDSVAAWIDAGATRYTADWAGVTAFYDAECGSCHDDGSGGPPFTLEDWEADLADGTGTYFVAGDPASSLVWQRLAELDGAAPMPDGGTLPAWEIDHVQAWLEAGAPLD